MTDKQKEELLRLKAQGLTKEQAIARVFTSKSAAPQAPKTQGSFAGTQDRLAEVGRSTVDTINQNLEGTGEFAGQTPLRRGVQATAAGFMTPVRGGFAMLPSQVREPAEKVGEKIGEGIGKGISALGQTKPIQELEKRTKPGGIVEEGLGIFSGLGEIAGTIAGTGGTVGTLTTTANFAGRQAARLTPGKSVPGVDTPPGVPPVIARQTPEKLFSEVETDLQRISKDPNLTPAERAAAAEASLSFRERLAGVRPDEKKRIQEMAPGTLERYFDQAHMRNVDDMVDSPYTLGANRADDALEGLNKRLTETGGIIGNTRQKLATYKLGPDEITGNTKKDIVGIESAFLSELAKLNLSIKNGQIGVTPGKIAKTASNSDINTLQTLYNDMLTFKQSPTVANAIDLRMKFDGKINFDKSAREASNSVDPLSKAVRAEIAKSAARTVGKTEARELARYSDFMEAYADLKSYTDRAAGGEYLLRLVLSGRGGEAKKLINTVKAYTGIDLMDDALAMKLATDVIGNDSQKNLFRQEVTKAGLDAARIFSGDVRGFTEAVAQKLIDKGIDPEDVYRAIAAGTAGYVLMTYVDEEGLTGAGIAVLGSMSPQARKQALKQADEIAKSSGKTLKVSDDVRDGVQMALKDVDMTQMQSKGGRAGGSTIELDDIDELDRLKAGMETPGGLSDTDFIEAQALLEKYDIPYAGKAPSATTKTTDLVEEAKGKTLDEFVKAKTTRPDYGYGHSPNEDGVRAFNLTEKVDGEQMIPEDMYTQWYGSRGTPEDLESIAVLKKIKGNPEAEVTIYRASPKDEWNYGDWTTFSKKYAESHAEGNNLKVFSKKVKAKDVRWAMDDVNEFGYFPEGYKSQLEDIWKQANNKGTDLVEEAKKYKSAEEFVKAQLPDKEYVTVYHRTNSPLEDFKKSGAFSKENKGEFFVSNKPDEQIKGYGDNVLEIRVKENKLEINDEFPSGEEHYTLDIKDVDEAIREKNQLEDIWRDSN